jgi:hypothetical protein
MNRKIYMNTLKALLLACGFFLMNTVPLRAQTGLTMYNMHYLPQSNYLNPANVPTNKVNISLPGFSGTAYSNLLSLDNMGYSFRQLTDGDFDEQTIISNLLSNAQTNNRLNSTAQLELLGVGIRSGRHYFSFSIREQISTQLEVPRELFQFLHDYNNDFANGQSLYDVSDISLSAQYYRPYMFSYAFELSENLTLGAQVSYISGLFNVTTVNNTIELTQPSPLEIGFNINGQFHAQTAGLSFPDSEEFTFGDGFLRPRNHGIGFGLGGKLTLLDKKLELSASAINLGSIVWKNRVSNNYINISTIEEEEDLEGAVESFLDLEAPEDASFSQMLHPSVFLSGNYFLNPNSSIGILMYGKPVDGAMNPNFGLTYNTQVKKWLGVGAGYYFADNTHSLGAGVSLNLGPVQWYVISDNFLFFFNPGSSRRIHGQTGINLTFGRMTREESMVFEGEEEGAFEEVVFEGEEGGF